MASHSKIEARHSSKYPLPEGILSTQQYTLSFFILWLCLPIPQFLKGTQGVSAGPQEKHRWNKFDTDVITTQDDSMKGQGPSSLWVTEEWQ